jgi:hypothetical protein
MAACLEGSTGWPILPKGLTKHACPCLRTLLQPPLRTYAVTPVATLTCCSTAVMTAARWWHHLSRKLAEGFPESLWADNPGSRTAVSAASGSAMLQLAHTGRDATGWQRRAVTAHPVAGLDKTTPKTSSCAHIHRTACAGVATWSRQPAQQRTWAMASGTATLPLPGSRWLTHAASHTAQPMHVVVPVSRLHRHAPDLAVAVCSCHPHA